MVEKAEWLIRKDGYFYRPNCQGYTTHKHEAGRYTKEKAEKEASVEPWHMKAIHESECPDDAVSAIYKDKDTRIVTLEAQLAEAKQALTYIKDVKADVPDARYRFFAVCTAENALSALEATPPTPKVTEAPHGWTTQADGTSRPKTSPWDGGDMYFAAAQEAGKP